MKSSHSFVNRIFALFVLFGSLGVFFATMGPSIALWDCGEYLATWASLGIPHPPGTPLLAMIGRVVLMMLGFIPDPGFRVNCIAATGGAVVAMLTYLIAVRVIIACFGGELTQKWQRFSTYIGGLVAGFYCAFGTTNWFCSVEGSEQCNFSLIPVALSVWLVIKWAQSKDPLRDRLLLLTAYIGFAGASIHMISMITLPVIFLFVLLCDATKRYDWRLWVCGLALSAVMYNLSWFILACPITAAIAGIISLVDAKNKKSWSFCFLFALVAFLGFSSHLYMPIRSATNPAIDMNHPVTWKAFTESLDRKQYGSESMVSRSFWPRASRATQFGIEGHMGYGGFHITQFFHFSDHDTEKNFFDEGALVGTGKLLIYLIPTFIMLFGFWYVWRRNKSIAVLLIGCVIISTLVLTWYMNFADGTRPEKGDYLSWVNAGKPGPMPVVYREVRVRDYFWNAGFMFFGLWVGVGCACILGALFTSKNTFLKSRLAPALLILFAASPALPLTQNYQTRDRHRNLLPHDYAYNLLMSCDKNALLFTNGDNDTYPLWALQEAFGIRKDVRVVNLSLLNTDWHIKHLKAIEPTVPISYTETQIDALRPSLNPFTTPVSYTLPNAGLAVALPIRSQANALRVQDMMVLNIVDANAWRKPVYFAMTVSEDNFMGLGPYMSMEGLVYRLTKTPVPSDKRIDEKRTAYLIDSVYRFRNFEGPGLDKGEAARGLLSNYSALFMETALSYRPTLSLIKASIDSLRKLPQAGVPAADNAQALTLKHKEYDVALGRALGFLSKAAKVNPLDWRPSAAKHQLLMELGNFAEAEINARAALASDSNNTTFLHMMGQVYEQEHKVPEATAIYERIVLHAPDSWEVVRTLAMLYTMQGKFDNAAAAIQNFQIMHPGDRRCADILQQINALKTNGDTAQRKAG